MDIFMQTPFVLKLSFSTTTPYCPPSSSILKSSNTFRNHESLPIVKDIDQYDHGGTQPERMEHLAKMIYKHGQRIETILSVFKTSYDALEGFLKSLGHSRGILANCKKNNRQVIIALENVYSECDAMLKLRMHGTEYSISWYHTAIGPSPHFTWCMLAVIS